MAKGVMRLLPDGNPDVGWSKSELTPPEAFTTSDKTEIISEYHTSSDERILVGVWECAPCREEIDAYPVDELMSVISGSVTLTREDGSSETFTKGDHFFIAKGTKCVWEITETLRKYYMIAQ
ncbi:MAG: cupin domain-containing protein [Limibacillus sp.]|jgi:uncharacterized protein